MEEERRWEDMNTDCLVEVFRRIGLESLALHIPFVCKPWHKASLQPHCWKILDFSILNDYDFAQKYTAMYDVPKFSNVGFVKFVLHRSCKSVESIILPNRWDLEIMKTVADNCPSLKKLYSPFLFDDEQVKQFAEIIGSFSLLEFLNLNNVFSSKDALLMQVSSHCPNLASFSIGGTLVKHSDALLIVKFLPEIKSLHFDECWIHTDDLKIILQGCRKVDCLVVHACAGFYRGDQELLELTSGINYVDFADSGLVKLSKMRLDVERRIFLAKLAKKIATAILKACQEDCGLPPFY